MQRYNQFGLALSQAAMLHNVLDGGALLHHADSLRVGAGLRVAHEQRLLSVRQIPDAPLHHLLALFLPKLSRGQDRQGASQGEDGRFLKCADTLQAQKLTANPGNLIERGKTAQQGKSSQKKRRQEKKTAIEVHAYSST